jgi:hypothetical protein
MKIERVSANVSTVHAAEITLRRTGFAEEFLKTVLKDRGYRTIVKDLFCNRAILKTLPSRPEHKQDSHFSIPDIDKANELLLDEGVLVESFWKYLAQNYEFARLLAFFLFGPHMREIQLDMRIIPELRQRTELCVSEKAKDEIEIIKDIFFCEQQLSSIKLVLFSFPFGVSSDRAIAIMDGFGYIPASFLEARILYEQFPELWCSDPQKIESWTVSLSQMFYLPEKDPYYRYYPALIPGLSELYRLVLNPDNYRGKGSWKPGVRFIAKQNF